jgi:Uma2 family endonuclease
VEGNNTIRIAPDIFVVFGRPKGDRGFYMQWLEDNIAPQVAFEILSPENRVGKLFEKLRFVERYGVEEYYVYDPDNPEITGWLRKNGESKEIDEMKGWISPRLQIRFDLVGMSCAFMGPTARSSPLTWNWWNSAKKPRNRSIAWRPS